MRELGDIFARYQSARLQVTNTFLYINVVEFGIVHKGPKIITAINNRACSHSQVHSILNEVLIGTHRVENGWNDTPSACDWHNPPTPIDTTIIIWTPSDGVDKKP
ncbi:MAG TPA: hypothetical protein PLF95_09015, partial [Bacteroidales bacterium]|nr:hypothetical protein [Bacteroidales bacterium]